MRNFKVILWDIDNTLLNFTASERAGIRMCFEKFGLGECTDEMLEDYAEINIKYWQKLERGELSKDQVLVGRFMEFFEKYGRDTSVVEAFNDAYQLSLGDTIVFEPYAKELVWGYKGRYKQFAASNGTLLAQTKKLKNSGLSEVLDGAFISDEIGVEKPMQGFFDAVFAAVPECTKDEILIIGDSLTSDMKGGADAGIQTCWYNPKCKINNSGLMLDYEIHSLREVQELLGPVLF
ncbi:MAG: YjjG family noncanonical pyrimidine nucleotidase [Clostridiales bacterium]|nr:YjjG family noncanonical pyrimidine nucleotidase [Candidatus Blautia equi]